MGNNERLVHILEFSVCFAFEMRVSTINLSPVVVVFL
jgi:hypothetical protein